MTRRVSIAAIARESGVDYHRTWKAAVSAGGWDGLTKDEVEKLRAGLDRLGLGVEVPTASPMATTPASPGPETVSTEPTATTAS